MEEKNKEKYTGIAKPLKMAMVDKGVSQKQIADRLELSTQSLNNSLKHDRMVFNTAQQIADILNCDIVLQDRETKKIY